jgi:uncharacterized protein YecE (DUF72 family)
MKRWWIGCSGFYYKNWRGSFYPPELAQRKWFEFYCETFNTVELNVTFYRFPKIESLRSWYSRSPQQFRFTVKAPRLITHYKRFNNVTREIREFYDVVSQGLADKLGTILFQLHPGLRYSEENLQRIFDALDPAFTNVLEFRHESWWNSNVVRALKDHGLAFCGISYPGLPDDVMKTSNALYYRFHGVPKLYLSSYPDDELKEKAETINKLKNVSDVYAYFNNDIEVAAIFNARKLMELTGTTSCANFKSLPINLQ